MKFTEVVKNNKAKSRSHDKKQRIMKADQWSIVPQPIGVAFEDQRLWLVATAFRVGGA